MTFVQLLVEDEFTPDHQILHSDVDFLSFLKSEEAKEFVQSLLPSLVRPTTPKDYWKTSSELNQEDKNSWKKIAVCCLQSFIAVNWFQMSDDLESSSVYNLLKDFFQDSDCYLEINDESFHGIKYKELLATAKYFLGKGQGASIWKVRYLIVHQVVLAVPNTAIYLELRRTLHAFEAFLTDPTADRRGLLLKAQVAVELSQAFLWFTDVGSSKPLIDSVQEYSGLKVEFSGAMGKRTKFQEKETSQLYIKLSREAGDDLVQSNQGSPLNHPKNVSLEDELLLSKVKFVEAVEKHDESKVFLDYEEELILLASTCHLRRMGSYDSEEEFSSSEELITLLDFLIERSRLWVVRFEALYLRSLVQRKHRKRIERSMVQLNHLVDAFKEFDRSSLTLNIKFVYASMLTPRWLVQKSLADVLSSMGCIKSALDIYLELGTWEDMVSCYTILDRRDKAEEVVRQQISNRGETPYLLCLLGDATQDVSLYEKAWEMSGQKYSRAKRDLGNYYFKKKDYVTCKEHYLASLSINSLQIPVWQRLAFAALDTEDYQLSVRAYRRFVEFEPDVFEAWNNMAKAYIKLGKKETAYSTLQEAIKCNFEEWRLWQNYLTVAVDIGAFEEVIRSWHRLIDIKGKFEDDEIIEILVNAILTDVNDINGHPASKSAPKLLALFARIKGTAYSSVKLWLSYAKLLVHQRKDFDQIVDAVRRANRAVTQTDQWDKDPEKLKKGLSHVVESLDILVKEVEKESDADKKKASIASSRLTMESMVRGVERTLSSWDPAKVDVKPIDELLTKIRTYLERLK